MMLCARDSRMKVAIFVTHTCVNVIFNRVFRPQIAQYIRLNTIETRCFHIVYCTQFAYIDTALHQTVLSILTYTNSLQGIYQFSTSLALTKKN